MNIYQVGTDGFVALPDNRRGRRALKAMRRRAKRRGDV